MSMQAPTRSLRSTGSVPVWSPRCFRPTDPVQDTRSINQQGQTENPADSNPLSLYNNQHRHSGIGYHTPADVHYGRAETIQTQRVAVLDAAYQTHPERFVRKPPTPPPLPQTAWINKPEEDTPTQ